MMALFYVQYMQIQTRVVSLSQTREHQEAVLTNPIKTYKIKQYQPDGIISQFSYMLIRPPRFLYNEKLLALNDRKLRSKFKMQKLFIPFQLTLYTVENMEYVILYLHGNSSSRLEGKIHVANLPDGVGLACFDFNGCGLRSEAFITLGKKESAQVDVAAKYLKNMGYKVVGWGRSMGAVSLLLSQQCDIMVADSPFNSLGDLCKESSSKVLPPYCCCFFNCLYPCFFQCIRWDVEKKSGLDINELEIGELLKQNPRNKQRSLAIIVGINDAMIPLEHGRKIFNLFPSPKKKLIIFHGTHNSERPAQINGEAFQFIHDQLGLARTKESYYKNFGPLTQNNRQESEQTQTTAKQEYAIEMEIFHKESSCIELFPSLFNNSKFSSSVRTDKLSEFNQNDQLLNQRKKESIFAETNGQSKLIVDESMEKPIIDKQMQNNSIKIYPKNKQSEC